MVRHTLMRWLTAALVLLLLAGCGSTSPVGPSPITPVAPPSFAGTVTETLTGAPVSSFTALVTGSRVTISAPGYVTRETRTSSPSVDLIRETGFDLAFYRQFARGALDASAWPLRVLAQAPSIYLQTAGLSAANIAALEQTARDTLPALTGGRFHVQAWETGAEARPERPGWIVVELVSDEAKTCGNAAVGSHQGHIWLNTAPKCHRGGSIAGYPSLFAHELGHALGFWHVSITGSLMQPMVGQGAIASGAERHHAAVAYSRQAGNLDVDIDSTFVSAQRVVID